MLQAQAEALRDAREAWKEELKQRPNWVGVKVWREPGKAHASWVVEFILDSTLILHVEYTSVLANCVLSV